ncbi:unnamed protein product [Eruca vesicaria subsp. sativa]|uniref:F-box domain-containing protein n=1 Tax=Eruca vesicaria subsp. sativa TaxID=29727 RepID=A0ABC8K2M0_ERUVS|nr:unnamed protein product [Eruca vesicaria subsp. sativa]
MVKYLSMISAIQWKKRRSSSKEMRRARGGRMRRIQRRDDFVAPEITFDLVIEILSRLPAKSLMRFRCVSKLWFGLIRSRYFSNLHLTKKISSSPPCGEPLLLYVDFCTKSELLSLTLSSSNAAESSWLEPDFTFPGMGGMGVHRTLIFRGLILYTFCQKSFIYNPATRQRLNLPTITFAQQERSHKNVYYFFGHDPVLDQYKIVCNVFERWITSEFWVFVLEPGSVWKRIEYDDQPHAPSRQGLCMDGVIYYLASTPTCPNNVYCFDVRSEEIRAIQAPHAVSQFSKLLNFIEHGGKPTLFDYTHIRETGVSELWVLEDGLGGTWSRKSLVLKPCQRHLVDNIIIGRMVHSTPQNSEIILALPSHSYLLYYDLIKNDLRKVNIIRATTRDVYIRVMDICENILHLEA